MDAARLARLSVDGLQYGVALTALLSIALAPLSLLLAGDLVLLKYGLFLAGMTLMLLGAVKARPRQQHVIEAAANWRPRLSDYLPSDSYAEDGFGGRVHRLPPAAWVVRGKADRLSDGGRFLVAWLVAWATSYLLEAVFYVGVAPALR
ncbi:MAG: hypothetical protein ABEJ92_11190 [Halobacteriales archaeon]